MQQNPRVLIGHRLDAVDIAFHEDIGHSVENRMAEIIRTRHAARAFDRMAAVVTGPTLTKNLRTEIPPINAA